MSQESPTQQLHTQLTETFDRPFRYDEAADRYADEFDAFQQTFASVVRTQDYRHGPVNDDRSMAQYVTAGYPDDAVDGLVALRDYLDAEDAWFLSRSFRRDADHRTYTANVPELDEATFDRLYDTGLLSAHGGISIITDEGWWAIYATTGEDVYQPPDTGIDAESVVDAVED